MNERTYKLGRRTELIELQQARRIEIDLLVRALRDLFEPRDVDLAYTEHINVVSMKVYMKEIEKKHAALAKICRELAVLQEELALEAVE
jgi:predicted SAM-dependent methyltransferase